MTNNERRNARGSQMISNIHFGNNNKYIGLVDSGSDVSLIDWSVFENIPSKNILKIWKSRLNNLTVHRDMELNHSEKLQLACKLRGNITK